MLILASASPRRHEILKAAGIDHIVRPVSILEERHPGEEAISFVQRMAREKALAVQGEPGDVVLGSDTVVLVGEDVFGKPSHEQEAANMLRALSGRDHAVCTGICLRSDQRLIVDVSQTRVWFVKLSEHEIQEYTRSGESKDKAGAYAIQGLASKFVRRIEGCYHNVVGFPIALVYHHLKTL
jgi:septum formation protein